MLVMCGCIGKSGGGWAHYVGQEKLRPQTGWTALAFALDWHRPPRQMNSTSFFYAHTDQWRYEKLAISEILSPLADPKDYTRLADRLQRARRAHGLAALGTAAADQPDPGGQGCRRPPAWTPRTTRSKSLKDGKLRLACEDPDNPANFPRNLFVWRSNLLGSSGKGHEYFLKHLLGTDAWRAGQGSGNVRRREARGSELARRRRPRASSTCW